MSFDWKLEAEHMPILHHALSYYIACGVHIEPDDMDRINRMITVLEQLESLGVW